MVWKVVLRLCQGALAMVVALAVWSVGFASDRGPAPVLPDTRVEFSLEMTVVGGADHPVIYGVEQRARPDYRIFAFDPATGADRTVFSVPERALVYGIALSVDRSTLAIAYTPEFDLDGSGLWTLDLHNGGLTEVRAAAPGIHHVDPVWTDDGTAILTTRVERRDGDERLGINRTSVLDGSTREMASDAIDPVVVGDAVYALSVDDAGARRGIVRIDEGHPHEIVGGIWDLDHLVADPTGTLHVAAIETPEPSGGPTFGSVADAHGNHRQPSSWWTVHLDRVDRRVDASEIPASIIHDAVFGDDATVSATAEGVALVSPRTGASTKLIASRAIRFVAAAGLHPSERGSGAPPCGKCAGGSALERLQVPR